MKLKISTIALILFLTIIATGVGYYSFMPTETKTENISSVSNSYHIFKGFSHGTIIQTDVLGNNKAAHSFEPFEIKKDNEELKQKLSNDSFYKNSYDVFYKIKYKIKSTKTKTIDVLLNINKNNGHVSVRVKNVEPKSLVGITNITNTLNKNTPTDWSGNIVLSNNRAHETICIVFENYMTETSQICHIIQENKENTNA
ncbi:MAG: hypothetical protein CMH31_05895 [Micavibrio sp.]|nr:hypothetical protein [Micavibrio sp.]|tara:strand:- start:520 stop:1116 length:597 start_codon:yes stop_codon:yes gene_type:complete